MRQRRKPYFVIGWSVYVLSNLVLAFIGTPSMACLIALVSYPSQTVSQGVQRDRGQLHAIRMRPAAEVTHLFRPTPASVLGPVVPVLTAAWLAGTALLVVVQVFVMTAGYMLSDVMADALVVERQASMLHHSCCSSIRTPHTAAPHSPASGGG